MRTTMKGGVWKNSEDEILKAAVMKYGLNNWSRVASLLVRKSAKQCKSRWYEWLDPSVKKTEWSREEEEKLLHLAKLFPNQWRTIAPIVGRTAHQCLEHYDQLLDQAQGRTEQDRVNDPRRLRPGEIDPHPETKPSRADAVDMDDDEKEMLAEARARLANTRGKKAKRKAREKQLEEARRLSALQKRRELKAAGIAVGRMKRRRNDGIDYGREVPFETQPPKGFYAIGAEETPKVSQRFANVTLQQLEGQRRVDDEKRLRKEDTKKLKRMMDDNLPQAMELIEKINDPNTYRKRTKLSLPTPQLSDADLDEILQIGSEISKSAMASSTEGAAHSRELLGAEQQKRPLTAMMTGMLPMRTPMRENTVLLEAQNAVARNFAETPLEGGANPTLHDVSFGPGATPQVDTFQTPNPLAALRSGTGITAVGVRGQTPSVFGATPMRDDLSLHEGSSVQGIRGLDALIRMQVKAGLAELPAPQHEIEVSLPDSSEAMLNEEGTTAFDLEEDAEECIKRKEEEESAKREVEKKKQSQVVQQCLPRPLFPEKAVFESSNYEQLKGVGADCLKKAEELLHDEMKTLILNDAVRHPIPIKGLRCPRNIPHLDNFDLDDLGRASALVEVELTLLRENENEEEELDILESKELRRAWDEALDQTFLYDPISQSFMADSGATQNVRLAALKLEFEQLKSQLVKGAQKAKKVEQKLSTVTQGYAKRSNAILKSLEASWNELQNLSHDLNGYNQLQIREQQGLRNRKTVLKDLVEKEKIRHEELQNTVRRVLVPCTAGDQLDEPKSKRFQRSLSSGELFSPEDDDQIRSTNRDRINNSMHSFSTKNLSGMREALLFEEPPQSLNISSHYYSTIQVPEKIREILDFPNHHTSAINIPKQSLQLSDSLNTRSSTTEQGLEVLDMSKSRLSTVEQARETSFVLHSDSSAIEISEHGRETSTFAHNRSSTTEACTKDRGTLDDVENSSSADNQSLENRKADNSQLVRSTFKMLFETNGESWTTLWDFYSRLSESLVQNNISILGSLEKCILEDLRSFGGQSTLQWMEEFRRTNQSDDESNRKEQCLCYLCLTDLICISQLELTTADWNEIVNGALYDGAFHDILSWRNGMLLLSTIINRLKAPKQYQLKEAGPTQFFVPCLDWYLVASVFQWFPGRSLHLPRLNQCGFSPNGALKDYVFDYLFTEVLEGVLAGDMMTLSELNQWMFEQFTPNETHNFVGTWGLDFFLMEYPPSQYIQPIKYIGDLYNRTDLLPDQRERLQWAMDMCLKSRHWTALLDFAEGNKNMHSIYYFCIRGDLTYCGLHTRKEGAIAKRCLIYEHQKVLSGELSKTNSWRIESSWSEITDDILILSTAQCIVPRKEYWRKKKDIARQHSEFFPDSVMEKHSENELHLERRNKTETTNADVENHERLIVSSKELCADIISIIFRFIAHQPFKQYITALRTYGHTLDDGNFDALVAVVSNDGSSADDE